MRRLALPALLVLLSGCGGDNPPLDLPFGLSNTTANRPSVDGYTMRRVMGEPDDVPPLQMEPGNVWPAAEVEPRRSVFEPEPEQPQQPRARRGSSTPPVADVPQDPNLQIPAQPGARPTPPPRPQVGQPVVIPGQPGGVTTGGTGAYQTFQTPGGGSGVAVPGPGNTMTIIGADGQVRTVPRQ